jgi:hypothetical protein
MSETQFQQGLDDLRRRLSAAGLNILKQEEYFDSQSILFRIGDLANNTDFMVSRNFLTDFVRAPTARMLKTRFFI